LETLHKKYEGQTVSIIGSGPSIEHLELKHFEDDPVIAINRAVVKVEALAASGVDIYSLQKDGDQRGRLEYQRSSDCKYQENCQGQCGLMVRPERAALIVHKHESNNCFPDYSPRFVFDWKYLGMPCNEFSMATAIQIGRFMGCAKFRFICCDAHATGDLRHGETGQVQNTYQGQRINIKMNYLPDLDHEFITPGPDIEVKWGRKVSIIIPVIRPEKAKRCVDAIRENAGLKFDQYEVLTAQDIDGAGCPEMVKRLTEMSVYDLVMFLGDDTIPQKDFLKNALIAMDSLPDGWGVVGLNTEGPMLGLDDAAHIPKDSNPVAHWLVDKRMLEHIPGGNFFSTEYKHCWCDNELRDIAIEQGRWTFAMDAEIKHDHPINTKGELDDALKKAYSEENLKHDKKTYFRRKIERTRDRKGLRLALAYPVTYEIIYTAFCFSNLAIVANYIVESLRNNGSVPDINILMPEYAGNHDAVRNNLVTQALVLGCTHILMMDTDQVYHAPDMIQKLLDHKKSVVGARVHRRYPPFDPILLKETEDGKHYHMDHDEIERIISNGETVNVPATGCGCILYDMRVFIDIDPPWFQHAKTDEGRSKGEDIYFCEQLRRGGFEIFVDTSIDITHLTLYEVGMDTFRLFRKLHEREREKV